MGLSALQIMEWDETEKEDEKKAFGKHQVWSPLSVLCICSVPSSTLNLLSPFQCHEKQPTKFMEQIVQTRVKVPSAVPIR